MLAEVACGLRQAQSGRASLYTADYCSSRLPCTVAGNHAKWPAHALLGSQLVRRIDAIRMASSLGCSYAHLPLAGPAAWAESHFGLGGCKASAASCTTCTRTGPTFGSEWHAIDRGKFLWRGRPPLAGNSGGPLASRLLKALRARLHSGATPWFSDHGSSAEELQVAVHLRRGDLASHGLESDRTRWVPDEYYEEILPRLVRAIATAAPVAVHVCSEMPAGWSSRAAEGWERLLCAAGARRVEFHFGQPWPSGWKSTKETDAGILETFHHMADADVLVTAVSGFSKAAAQYSAGLVLHLSGGQPGACVDRHPKPADLPADARLREGVGTVDCVHRLPPPPRCTASTEERLQRILREPGHVDFQCCFGRWRNATLRSGHCLSRCLPIGDDIRARRPTPERHKHAVGDEPDGGMPMWTPVHVAWVWCGARSRAELLKQVRAAAANSPWETSLQRAAAALVRWKGSLRQSSRHRRSWASLWKLLR